ncbi:MAG: hypothetical protein AAB426_05840 [Myxococcota bacterium]
MTDATKSPSSIDAQPTDAAAQGRLWPLLAVLATLIAIGSVLGVLAFRQYVKSELAMRVLYREAQQAGATLGADECIGWTLAAQKRCTAMQSLCQGAIPSLAERCLDAGDRQVECATLGATGDTHWSHDRCVGRGYDPRNRGCAIAYLALAAYCHEHAAKEPR